VSISAFNIHQISKPAETTLCRSRLDANSDLPFMDNSGRFSKLKQDVTRSAKPNETELEWSVRLDLKDRPPGLLPGTHVP
jgi:hypothetical protein